MSLPETIAVRFTEEEAGYLSVRPVLRQTFRLGELADMVVRVTGKNPERLGQILRAGSLTYNGFRYWWPGFSASPEELRELLLPFPDDDPARLFRFEEATAVLLESGGGASRQTVELPRAQASARRLLWRRSPWQCLAQAARDFPPVYEHYSYAQRADFYRRAIPYDQARTLLAQLFGASRRGLRARLSAAGVPAALVFVCPRGNRPTANARS